MEILFENRELLVINKPPYIPSQPDLSGDPDALTLLRAKRGEGSAPLYLVHRLDRIVGGVLVFAKTKRAAAALSDLVSRGALGKTYLAVVDGAIPAEGVLEDYLIRDARTSRAHSVPKERRGAKFASLSYKTLAVLNDGDRVLTLVSVTLGTGRFHQIRIQFSTRGTPLLGDGKYGSRENRCSAALFAHSVRVPDKKGEKTVFALPDLTRYPWSLFADTLSLMGGSYDTETV